MKALKRQRHTEVADLLTDIALQVRSGVAAVSQLLGAPAQTPQSQHEELLALEGRALDLHFALMTHIRSVFLLPLSREDVFSLSQHLNRALEHVVATGDLMLARTQLELDGQSHAQLENLSRQSELTVTAMSRLEDYDHLEEYWIQMQRLTKQVNRTHRRWITATDGAFQPNIALQQNQVAEQMLAASHALRAVSVLCGSIVVRES